MPEYTYLLENRLSSAQQYALTQVRDAAREAGMTVFLAGGAVRDLTTGSSVRNLDFSVQGNALSLRAAIVGRGGELWGAHEPTRTLTFWFAGSVRVQVSSARSEEYPKPGKPVYSWSTIVDDLRRRDFTANAMALSLNEGSYGLLLDPLNGVADIEARLLRLASNYGFIEDPARMIRVVRLQTRLGWQMEEKTAARYANAKEADAIKVLSAHQRGYEIERIASEEDALVILKALEAEGWMEHLLPAWTSAKADLAGLENLRRNWIQLWTQGVAADLTAAQLELLTAKMTAAEIASFKKAMVHPGLVAQWEGLDERAKEFGRQLTGKAAATPSASWKLLTTEPAEPILWLAHTRKAGPVDAKFKNFFTVWPEFRKKTPTALMLEMRITPELPGYEELLEQLFFQLIDGNLETEEAMRAFLEPYSPPLPPPPPAVRRSRAKKSESKAKRRAAAADEDEDEDRDEDEDEAGSEHDEEDESDSDPELIPAGLGGDDAADDAADEEAGDEVEADNASPVLHRADDGGGNQTPSAEDSKLPVDNKDEARDLVAQTAARKARAPRTADGPSAKEPETAPFADPASARLAKTAALPALKKSSPSAPVKPSAVQGKAKPAPAHPARPAAAGMKSAAATKKAVPAKAAKTAPSRPAKSSAKSGVTARPTRKAAARPAPPAARKAKPKPAPTVKAKAAARPAKKAASSPRKAVKMKRNTAPPAKGKKKR